MGVLRDRRDRGLPFTLRAPRVEKNVTPLSRRLNFHRYGEWPGTGNGMVGEWWFDVYNFPRHFSRITCMNKISGVIYPGNFIVNPFPVQIFPSLFFIVVWLYIVCVQ